MKTSLIVEAALAGLFAAAAVVPAVAQDAAAPVAPDQTQQTPSKAPAKKSKPAKVHCYGVNACKGKSACSVEGKSSCKGQNACKGQGWLSLTAKTCKKRKGSIDAPKAAPAPAAAPVQG